MSELPDAVEAPREEEQPLAMQAPLEKGTDPLGDGSRLYRRPGQLAISGVLALVFVIMAGFDFNGGHPWRGGFAILIAALNLFIAVKERAKPPRV